jgi:hypothetical protein
MFPSHYNEARGKLSTLTISPDERIWIIIYVQNIKNANIIKDMIIGIKNTFMVYYKYIYIYYCFIYFFFTFLVKSEEAFIIAIDLLIF